MCSLSLCSGRLSRYAWRGCGVTVLALTMFSSVSAQPPLTATTLDELVSRCAPEISPVTMRYLINIESGFQPFSLNINRKLQSQSLLFKDALSAMAMANKLIKQGENIDMGLGQINSTTMQRLGLSVADIYDPCTNLTASAEVLKQCYNRALRIYPAGQVALTHALSCYNTGNFKGGLVNGYVAKLQNLATRQPERVPELLGVNRQSEQSVVSKSVPLTVSAQGELDAFSQAGNEDAFTARVP
ncbi:lytic transglycosylase domain-containing protein [Rosenbergiella epipactidis]|uniref:lytic transglycosylase domain-containing protein n=1 Tax=Rosenbergiella epipactidis TaxID=1544694 RepID=UPI001F4FD909|nr:lytic transglycosylase domain-containing protein [Rosenbergiella epipactidis]